MHFGEKSKKLYFLVYYSENVKKLFFFGSSDFNFNFFGNYLKFLPINRRTSRTTSRWSSTRNVKIENLYKCNHRNFSVNLPIVFIYYELSQKTRFQSVRIAALCLYNVTYSVKTWFLKDLSVILYCKKEIQPSGEPREHNLGEVL